MEYIASFIIGLISGAFIMGLVAGSSDNRDDHFSCANCKYLHMEEIKEPCTKCMRGCDDLWEDKDLEED